MTPASPAKHLVLGARLIEDTGTAAALEWTLANGSDEAFVVLRYIHRTFEQGQLLPEPNLVYIAVGEDGIIHLSKKLLPVPLGISVLTPFVPLGIELAPGATMIETIRVRTPIAAWNPYDELIQMTTGYRAMEQIQAKAFAFHLAVYAMGPPSSPPRRVDTKLGPLIYPRHSAVVDAQVVLDAPLVPWAGDAYR